jgi:hypothetical protein
MMQELYMECEMDIGIIIYSHTGHTLIVSQKLKDKLSSKGHTVTLQHLETTVPLAMSATTAELQSIPTIQPYDAVILCTPVRGGMPSPPMKAFLDKIISFEGKQVFFLVTGFFPAKWGRNQTLYELTTICESKKAEVCGVGSVRWSSFTRKQQINNAVECLSATI